MANLRSGEREAFWRAELARQAASGLSVRRFCQERGLSEPSFYAWRRTLQERDQAALPAFLPVVVASQASASPTTESAALPSSERITIELRGGRIVQLPETMATERLVALLRALEAGVPEANEVTP
jgi:transposase-like protein